MAALADPLLHTSPISKLPVKLLRRIVALVKEQDDHYRDFKSVSERKTVGTREGLLSAPFGAGVEALSLVNKTFRVLALPHMLETVTSAQLAETFFRFAVAGNPRLSKLIHTIDAEGYEEDNALAAASAITILPEVTSIRLAELSSGLLRLAFSDQRELVPDEDDDDEEEGDEDAYTRQVRLDSERRQCQQRNQLRDLAQYAILKIADRFTEVYLRCAKFSTWWLEQCPRLCRLHLEAYTAYPNDDQQLQRLLPSFHLTHLSLTHTNPSWPAAVQQPAPSLWLSQISLPSLTSLDFTPASRYYTFLGQLDTLAPNVTTLTVRNCQDSVALPEVNLNFPNLQRLSLFGRANFDHYAQLFLTCPVRHLFLGFDSKTYSTCKAILPADASLPSTLRSMRLSCSTPSRPDDVVEYTDNMRQRNIHFSLDYLPLSNPSSMRNYPPDFSEDDELALE
ncbi:hypothetical protein JCM10207_007784 [Rhodosporidiobolus poonsookiae]